MIDADEPEPVFTFSVCFNWAQIFIGCGAGVWVGRRMIAANIWDGAVLLLANAFFWVSLFGVTVCLRYRRVRAYRALSDRSNIEHSDDPART